MDKLNFKIPKGWTLLEVQEKPYQKKEKEYFIIVAVRESDRMFVTWEYNDRSECYWGHYFTNVNDAIEDSQKRIA